MKVVNISLDPKILDKGAPAAKRAKAYGEMVEEYAVVVPTPSEMTVNLSNNVTIYGVCGKNKISQLLNIYQKISQLAKEDKCDVISSVDMYYLGLLSLFVAKKYHLGLEISVLGIEKINPLRKSIAKYVMKRASSIRALSHRLEDRLVKEFGVDKDSIKVISIYVPTDTLGFDIRTLPQHEVYKYEESRKEFGEKYAGKTNFLNVSRLVPIKHIERQIEAIDKLKEEIPNVCLHLVGDGPQEEELKDLVKRKKLDDYVIFHGRKTGHDLGIFYTECDCLLLTSDYEGWGMVIVEAATAGLPAIMTDVGCANEFLIDGESGIVVPVNDEQALVEAMKKMATDTKLREELSYGTKNALDSLESFDEILKQYLDYWQVALANKL